MLFDSAGPGAHAGHRATFVTRPAKPRLSHVFPRLTIPAGTACPTLYIVKWCPCPQDARHFIIANDGRVSRHRTWEESGGRTTLQLMRSTASRSDPCIRPLTCGGRDSVEAMWVSITTNVPPRRVPQHVAAPSPATARTLNHVRSLPCACSYGLSPTR